MGRGREKRVFETFGVVALPHCCPNETRRKRSSLANIAKIMKGYTQTLSLSFRHTREYVYYVVLFRLLRTRLVDNRFASHRFSRVCATPPLNRRPRISGAKTGVSNYTV